MQTNFANSHANQITLQHGCSPVNLLHIFRTSFLKYLWRDASVLILVIFEETLIYDYKKEILSERNSGKQKITGKRKMHHFSTPVTI